MEANRRQNISPEVIAKKSGPIFCPKKTSMGILTVPDDILSSCFAGGTTTVTMAKKALTEYDGICTFDDDETRIVRTIW